MPRAKKPASTADLPDGISLTPYGTYRVRWRDASNKADGKTFKRLEDAKQHLHKVHADLNRGTLRSRADGRISVQAFAEEWLSSAVNLGPGGRETYERDLEVYILPELGGLKISNLSATAINRFLVAELEAGKAPSSVSRHYGTIHRLCEVAVRSGRLATNPCVHVDKPHVPPSEMRFLAIDEVMRLADAMGERWRAWVLFCAFAGTRWSETVGLRRARITGNRVLISEKLILRDKKWCREAPKTVAGRRTITIPDVAVEALDVHLAKWSAPGPDGLVFPSPSGRTPMRENFRSRVFNPGLEAAGIDPGFRIHDLRHTAVALAIKAGAHPKAIQARMGHASISVTLGTYGHLFPEMDGEIAASFDGMVREHTNAQAAVRAIVLAIAA